MALDYLQKARQRARRRKSAWNLLLPLFIIPLVVVLSYGAFLLMWKVNAFVYPSHEGQLHVLLRKDGLSPGQLFPLLAMMFGPFAPALALSMIIGNSMVWLLPPARRALDNEAKGHPGTDFFSAQKGLYGVLKWFVIIGTGIGLAGAITLSRI